jgi:hypothetical protein
MTLLQPPQQQQQQQQPPHQQAFLPHRKACATATQPQAAAKHSPSRRRCIPQHTTARLQDRQQLACQKSSLCLKMAPSRGLVRRRASACRSGSALQV